MSNRHNIVPMALDQLRMKRIIEALESLKSQNRNASTVDVELLISQWQNHFKLNPI